MPAASLRGVVQVVHVMHQAFPCEVLHQRRSRDAIDLASSFVGFTFFASGANRNMVWYVRLSILAALHFLDCRSVGWKTVTVGARVAASRISRDLRASGRAGRRRRWGRGQVAPQNSPKEVYSHSACPLGT